jgi:hypothetical protein
MIGHEASTLASEYGPQWMNMPNFAARYHDVRSSSSTFTQLPSSGLARSGDAMAKRPMNGRKAAARVERRKERRFT